VLALATGCDAPETDVVLDNHYPTPSSSPIVIFQAQWQAVSFTMPILPGTASMPQSTVAATDNSAYALIAPGWDANAGMPPTSLVVLQSRGGYTVHLNQTLHIAVDDTAFAGNCAAGSTLTQAQADFITQRVFAPVFSGMTYDAATCTTTTDSGK
jgi:hypothetical protein